MRQPVRQWPYQILLPDRSSIFVQNVLIREYFLLIWMKHNVPCWIHWMRKNIRNGGHRCGMKRFAKACLWNATCKEDKWHVICSFLLMKMEKPITFTRQKTIWHYRLQNWVMTTWLIQVSMCVWLQPDTMRHLPYSRRVTVRTGWLLPAVPDGTLMKHAYSLLPVFGDLGHNIQILAVEKNRKSLLADRARMYFRYLERKTPLSLWQISGVLSIRVMPVISGCLYSLKMECLI